MRPVIWFILLFVVAVVAATLLGANDGLVTFYSGSYRVDVSLNLFILALFVTCFVLVSLIQGIHGLVGLPRRAMEWRVSRRDRLAQAALREALSQYFGGRYARAQRAAQRALDIQAETPELAQDNEFIVLGHLLGAGSLHQLQDRVRRDEQLGLALEAASRSPAARSAQEGACLLAAEWALDDHQAGRALEFLAELPPGVARRVQALRLKLRAARLANQPQEALKTAHLLAKHQAISKVAAISLLRSLAFEALDATRDADQLRRLWLQFDAADRRDPFVASRAVSRAVALGAREEAHGWLRPFFDRMADLGSEGRAAVCEALARSVEGLGPEWLPRLESAVTHFPREPAVALAVGAALAERGIYGKAKPLLQRAASADDLDTASRRKALNGLAHLALQQGNTAEAARLQEQAAGLF